MICFFALFCSIWRSENARSLLGRWIFLWQQTCRKSLIQRHCQWPNWEWVILYYWACNKKLPIRRFIIQVVIIRSELHMHLKSKRCKKLLKVITRRLTQTQDEAQCWYLQYYSNMHTIMSFKHSCFLIKFINNLTIEPWKLLFNSHGKRIYTENVELRFFGHKTIVFSDDGSSNKTRKGSTLSYTCFITPKKIVSLSL